MLFIISRCIVFVFFCFFFFKQKTAYEMRISDWSSGVCSSDLRSGHEAGPPPRSSDEEQLMTHRFDPTSLREYDIRGIVGKTLGMEIGRASCRERVCQYV